MALYVQKFGGTSVANLNCIDLVANRIIATQKQGHHVVVVLSAMAGETNRLVELAQSVNETSYGREYDLLLSSGELASIALLSMTLNNKGTKAKSFTASQVRIITNDVHRKAHIQAIETDRIQESLDNGYIPVVAGFQGVTIDGDITTLDRGGSDATAVALAAALDAEECQIFTDVDGVFNADPRVIPTAMQLDEVSYDEMLQMASLGAKVVQNYAVEVACHNQVPLRISSTFNDQPGTLLCHHVARLREHPITGIVSKRNIACVTIHKIPSRSQFLAKLMASLASKQVSIDMVVQQIHGTEGSISLTVNTDELAIARLTIEHFCEQNQLPPACIDDDVAKLSIVGRGLSSHHDILTQMFEVLGEHNIHPQMITTSEIKISAIVETKYLDIGVQALHNRFDLSTC